MSDINTDIQGIKDKCIQPFARINTTIEVMVNHFNKTKLSDEDSEALRYSIGVASVMSVELLAVLSLNPSENHPSFNSLDDLISKTNQLATAVELGWTDNPEYSL